MKLKTISITSLFAILGLVLAINIAKAEDDGRFVQVKGEIETRFERNKDIRNNKIEERKDIRASTTERIREIKASTTERLRELKDERKEIRASTTAAFKILKNERGEILKKIQANSYEMRKKALLSELNATYNNLVKVSGKILERIVILEGKARDMAKARADLTIANDKIAKAKLAIDAFTNLPTPTIANNTNSTTTEVNLEKPRKVGDDAIKAIKEARDSLKIVLKTIADVRPTTSTSTPPVSTSTQQTN